MSGLFSLKGKVVVVTGGSGFLGAQYCEAVRGSGGEVVNWDVTTGVNITSGDSVRRAVRDVVKNFGRIDVLVNNAAFNPAVVKGKNAAANWAPYENFPLDLWEEELRTNLTAQMLVTQTVAPRMMKQKSGSIVFIASDLALIGPQNSIYKKGRFKDIAYISSKAGVLGLMRSWASYLGPYNVRVNALVPGGMYHGQPKEFAKKNAGLNMLRRMSRPGEYNGPLIFLASNASSYMTGACVVVDGGRTAW